MVMSIHIRFLLVRQISPLNLLNWLQYSLALLALELYSYFLVLLLYQSRFLLQFYPALS